MPTAQSLARIERLHPRSVWPNEAQDFTPWLASHIDQLGEALGLELELQSEEAPVGGFSLDILAREVGRDRPVIVENQLEETDHRHLGQLLTYAAGYDAGVVVWIAREFRDKHRAALDLLNRRTDEAIEFFGVVVEVWRIADSPPAANFKVVTAPNEHSFTYKVEAGEQNEYWFRANPGVAQYYAAFSRQRKATVAVWIDGSIKSENQSRFDTLKQNKDEIEAELDDLNWERRDKYEAPRIATYRDASIEDTEETLEDIREWMVERLLAFKKVFGPKLGELVE